MRLLVRRESVRWLLCGAQRALVGVAALSFAYCTFVLADAWLFQRAAADQFERSRGMSTAQPVSSVSSAVPILSVATDGLIGRISIPRLGISTIVLEGTGRATLRRAVGHISGTPLPGVAGNTGLSAHRDTFFRPLRHIRHNDLIIVTTLAGDYRYRVVSTKVVGPDDVAVLSPSQTEILTLVTCYPFYFVGSAPERFIVRAERVRDS